MDELSDEEKTLVHVYVVSVLLVTKLQRCEQFTGVVLMFGAGAIRGFKILDGKHDHLPEDAFRNVEFYRTIVPLKNEVLSDLPNDYCRIVRMVSSASHQPNMYRFELWMNGILPRQQKI